ncbi:MAG: response regulator [Nitrospirota bacterium]|nr:MAG: response regulator [Nitrospirota bacterium]
MRILIAEDDKNLGYLLRNELEGSRYTIDLAVDGVDAVLQFISKRHDFIVFDIKMPKLDGINALRIIKKLDPDVPAITISGNAGQGDMAESVRAGAIRCLTKPFQVSDLKEQIEKYYRDANGNDK